MQIYSVLEVLWIFYARRLQWNVKALAVEEFSEKKEEIFFKKKLDIVIG